MRKLRVIPWVLGIGVIVGSIAGANRLLNNPTSEGAPAPAAPAAAPATEGLVAKGTVESDPPVVAYSLPAHLAAGQIVEVFVSNGTTVKVGDPLIRYDDTLLASQKRQADLAYIDSLHLYNSAVAAYNSHIPTIDKVKLAVKSAGQKKTQAEESLALAKKAFNTDFDIRMPNLKPEDKTPEARLKQESDFPPVVLARNALADAENAVALAEIEVRAAEQGRALLDEKVKQAKAHSDLVQNEVEKAKQAVADCTLKAKAAGTIERVTASVGQTVYPQSKPLLYLVPSGKRIVVAEIVPDFAYKIGGREGHTVTISDDSHTSLTYKGVVRRISDAFLPNARGTVDLTGKSNAVLNVEIEVTDATPVGKPPLRVGQPVRVSFP